MYVNCDASQQSWQDFTFVMPAVSVGNVGQLAADLIIHTLWMEKVGYFYTDAILPLVGNDPFAMNDAHTNCKLVTACEVYISSSQKLVVLQQRTPFVKGKRKMFQDELVSWIKEKHFKDVIILTSSFAQERIDKQMIGTQFRVVLSPKSDSCHGHLIKNTLHWVELERRQEFPAPPRITDDINSNQNGSHMYIPGGGIAKTLFEKLNSEDVSVTLLMVFCSEGDNTVEGIQLATHLNTWQDWIDLKKSQETIPNHRGGWRVPSSWKLTYGSRFEQILFQ